MLGQSLASDSVLLTAPLGCYDLDRARVPSFKCCFQTLFLVLASSFVIPGSNVHTSTTAGRTDHKSAWHYSWLDRFGLEDACYPADQDCPEERAKPELAPTLTPEMGSSIAQAGRSTGATVSALAS